MTIFTIKHVGAQAPIAVSRRVYKEFLRGFCLRNSKPVRVTTTYFGKEVRKCAQVLA